MFCSYGDVPYPSVSEIKLKHSVLSNISEAIQRRATQPKKREKLCHAVHFVVSFWRDEHDV
jgi:hypothetical protein